ncbi:MAG: MFS transporter [Acidobacteria bacterium]|nr:MFS transporter [Acidobacteriota bacterium]MCA1648765.1 MFS transporter [Acidobacteriota bacterium]
MRSILTRLGLDRRDVRAWVMYDWANSAFQTTIIAAVFPIYFKSVAAADLPQAVAISRFAWATTIAILIVAMVAPLLGAIADDAPLKKKLLGVFLGIGVSATAAMYGIMRGDWMLALVLFVIANVGVAGSIVFYESLLPHLVPASELDRVSSAGYAIGYLGGGVLLAINLLMIQKPALFGIPEGGTAVRLAFVSVAVWWLLFSIPLFRHVAEPPHRPGSSERLSGNSIITGARRLFETLKELRRYREAFVFLLAFLVYNDGIQTMIRMATIYGTEIGINETDMIAALLLTQFIGVPFAFMFGMVAGRVGAKRAVFGGLAVYAFITGLGYYMRTATHFYALAVMVGMVQGGTQALSRSMFASMIPRHKSSEFFAFFGVFERYAGILGPAVFAWVVQQTGTGRNAILTVGLFFIVGAIVLTFVDVEAGRRVARAAEAEAATAG